VLQRALEGRSGRTERSKGAQGRIMHQRPENRGALNKPTPQRRKNTILSHAEHPEAQARGL